ncbi:SDR family NAD(P)-dependent oxidoreductase [Paenibacillus peoriae]|jgi:NAD(P)-dependent dehydrogenase (short-subunit alcohol dehydrogenase family)|uniref:Short-chain dehydrogenase n=1 Tax=Paenibacillus jamilae TaxID=114136 RepID=A0ACC4ZXI6_9BACL|nr:MULTISPECIES: SDR family oxidoreductase [Paenibacillus]ADM68518.1 dehydrogenase [Paenibacillus polymyxa E681]AJE50808.1 short-chain dehydrogenase [Paenibacillus polymyxa]AUO05576.1 SDR family NAD(P)-dependent oxidoreductase [Paenibacillus sp. lzh-N1]KTS83004.1 short-chain dehydrogenase [Paenibacillus jamilae]MBP1175317.1 NAD(P)-dependent dehydrogenase (short-subunit alcohol dehydrogenase family) [Paenibacillus sp. PvR133]
MNKSKIVLITGGNKGIGFETARQLGNMGYEILIGARSEEKGHEAVTFLETENIKAKTVVLDVTNPSSVLSAVEWIEQEYGYLDILINNAGVFFEGNTPPSELELSVLKNTYETNVFGVFSVTKAILPLLKKSSAGRIVNLSSGLGSLTLNSDPTSEFYNVNSLAYNSSKTAVNALTVFFAKELRDTPIKINSVCPGFTATDLNGNSGYRTVEQAASSVVKLATINNDGPTGSFFDENGVVPW